MDTITITAKTPKGAAAEMARKLQEYIDREFGKDYFGEIAVLDLNGIPGVGFEGVFEWAYYASTRQGIFSGEGFGPCGPAFHFKNVEVEAEFPWALGFYRR